MPVKAFGIAASASASIASLRASGIHKVEDLMEVGANMRTGLGIRCRRSAHCILLGIMADQYYPQGNDAKGCGMFNFFKKDEEKSQDHVTMADADSRKKMNSLLQRKRFKISLEL
ncbi:hypothetical protein Pint_00131 [Pistacia integerrima]|uniref:Uncharacterized protein n=1 Tax=Pistacia integerrima TaxID=434235 RepID=A0ACC0ZIH0_9ROSI|nr:hypothetical protein Pint_00131 [Pistacia integerrima]